MGSISVNMSQLKKKFKVTSDNVWIFDNLVNNNGSMFVLDSRPYVEELNEFNVFYTLTE